MIPTVHIGASRQAIGVESVVVERSLEQIAARARCDTFVENRAAMAEGFQVDIDNARRFTGVVETYPGTPEQGFTIAGRSLTRGLLINHTLGTELFKEQTLVAIARSVGLPVGVPILSEFDADVARFRLKKAVLLSTALQELAIAHGLAATDTTLGDLRFFKLPDSVRPVESWELGRGDVIDIQLRPDVSEWRDEIVAKGWRFPVSSDVADIAAGQLGAQIVAGSIQPSRFVMSTKAANTKGRAGHQAATEAARRLGQSFPVEVRLRRTGRDTGDIVRVKRGTFDRAMVVRSLTWTLSKSQMDVVAQCVLPEVYKVTAAFDASLIQAVRS